MITYESSRDLPVEIAYNDSVSTLLAKRNYSYDSLGRVVSRTQTRGAGSPWADAFGHNSRSELTSATLGNDNFVWRIYNEDLMDEKQEELDIVESKIFNAKKELDKCIKK
ncbi:MAG: hypothetical protein K6B46_01620 [Opitutales bacterium]|nr:hypothetical protein [Opitutales bacterium]